ncbi:hypothetical protein [Nostoc favosum]|uniref:Uncharacterized protein n=1 Tax=Nostoc favosum CHAB5714 TaxID=2780399 RepID=A0ABS8IKP4_9NOSO|nr:hypothetical protein [Nostoc favosum]MCC5604817.1 hypothetical protein [Nostoc favosum CHAB5714]
MKRNQPKTQLSRSPALRARHSQEENCCGNAAAPIAGLGRRLAPFLAAQESSVINHWSLVISHQLVAVAIAVVAV